MVEHEMHRDGLRDRLLQQRQGLGGPPGERIGRPQGRGDLGDEEPDVRPLREVEGPFEHGYGLGEVSLAQRPKAHSPIYQDTAIGVIGSLGDLHSFLGGCLPLGEGAALGKGDDEAPREHTEARPCRPRRSWSSAPWRHATFFWQHSSARR